MSENKKSKKSVKVVNDKATKTEPVQSMSYDIVQAATREYNELVKSKASKEKIAEAFARVKQAESKA